ncbi:bifunctional aminoglycoside phosphotransferase/ATP-binding protein [Segnochrobactrum spirostomi]|uniref:AAA family ATPase n=1 Tax=Segnochrobactrum spirostomi TaxID=2608987 RepID=A0A6A7Y768_9HYPH|nr:AAA family ATPase [Segnochrobactrum spirostomi]MQT13502.1 AAA family ATPase [Segnochrobactrum spirostomi]
MSGADEPGGHAADQSAADQSAAFAVLADPSIHGGGAVVRFDTHGAVVFAGPTDVYKIKRAVRLPYMDLSTVGLRHAACAAEVAINRAYAPDLYLGVVAIVRRGGGLALAPAEAETDGAVDYAVHMRRFDETQTLDHVAERGALDGALIDALAAAIARAHRAAPRKAGFPALRHLTAYAADNARAFAAADWLDAGLVARIASRTDAAFAAAGPLMAARSAAGAVRRCHGDLHLRNIVLIDGAPTLFDAIEFDEAIATTDVLYDLAFTLMDLADRDLVPAANRMLNRYLWEMRADDQEGGLGLLPLFVSLRAAIRAKVTIDSLAFVDAATQTGRRAEIGRYAALADAALAPFAPRLVAVGGRSGTGKSSLAARLAPRLGGPCGALHLRSDLERKRLFGVGELDRLPDAAYRPGVSDEIYAILRTRTAAALAAGVSVIVDAAHLTAAERTAIAAVAVAVGVPFTGLWLEAPTALLQDRVRRRTHDASDATPDIVARQAEWTEPDTAWTRLDAGEPLEALAARAAEAIGV